MRFLVVAWTVILASSAAYPKVQEIEGLEITELTLTESQFEWQGVTYIKVSGSISNNGIYVISFPSVEITFKRNSQIVQVSDLLFNNVERGDLELRPGETGHLIEAFVPLVDHDEYTYRPSGIYAGVDSTYLHGVVEVIEESKNVLEDVRGYAIFVGEVVNNSNAYYRYVPITILVYDVSGGLIEEDTDSIAISHLDPGEVASYVNLVRVPYDRVASYDVIVGHERSMLLRPTVTKPVTWGEVKKEAR